MDLDFLKLLDLDLDSLIHTKIKTMSPVKSSNIKYVFRFRSCVGQSQFIQWKWFIIGNCNAFITIRHVIANVLCTLAWLTDQPTDQPTDRPTVHPSITHSHLFSEIKHLISLISLARNSGLCERYTYSILYNFLAVHIYQPFEHLVVLLLLNFEIICTKMLIELRASGETVECWALRLIRHSLFLNFIFIDFWLASFVVHFTYFHFICFSFLFFFLQFELISLITHQVYRPYFSLLL